MGPKWLEEKDLWVLVDRSLKMSWLFMCAAQKINHILAEKKLDEQVEEQARTG